VNETCCKNEVHSVCAENGRELIQNIARKEEKGKAEKRIRRKEKKKEKKKKEKKKGKKE